MTTLYMSGYDNELIGKEDLESTASFLPKPFSPRALLNRIGALLGFGDGEQSASGFGD
jgi:DNA-binding response OmpR family regulator